MSFLNYPKGTKFIQPRYSAPGVGTPVAQPRFSPPPMVYFPSKAAGTGRVASRIKRKSNYGSSKRGFLLSEQHFFDIGSATYQNDTTGSITLLNTIARGTGPSDRVGRSYTVTNVVLEGYLRNQATSTHNTCKVHLVWDYQPNKALATIADIFDTVTPTGQRKMETAERYKVLKTWQVALNGNFGQSASTCGVSGSARVNEKTLLTSADATGVIGNFIEGALLLVTRGDVAPGVTAAFLTTTVRIFFKE